jgi:hypothetical protein
MNTHKTAGFIRANQIPLMFAAGVFFARLISLLTMTLEGLRGYGDFINYFEVSRLPGWPFLHYWVEYPPVFPFLTELLNRLAGQQEHVFYYLLAFILAMADAANAFMFTRLAARWFPYKSWLARSAVYALVLSTLAYGWWYFDPLTVFLMLLSISLVLERRWLSAGGVIGVGVATKLFPGLVVLAAWRRCSWKQMALLLCLSLAPLILLYGTLWQASPGFTGASIRSQLNKGSWETIWALIDGNIRTGTFGAFNERLDPNPPVNPPMSQPVIPPLVSLVFFAAAGFVFLLLAKPKDDRQSLALVGFAWTLFLLWSPGWSPQWILYLLPLLLLVLPDRHAFLFTAVLILVNLLEWPVLLSRGYFWGLWITIPVRTLLLIILVFSFASQVRSFSPVQTPSPKEV